MTSPAEIIKNKKTETLTVPELTPVLTLLTDLDTETPDETMKSRSRILERIAHIEDKKRKKQGFTVNDREFIQKIRRWTPNEDPFNIFGRNNINAFEKSRFGYDIQTLPPFASQPINPLMYGQPLSMMQSPHPSIAYPVTNKKRAERISRIMGVAPKISPALISPSSFRYGKKQKYVPINI